MHKAELSTHIPLLEQILPPSQTNVIRFSDFWAWHQEEPVHLEHEITTLFWHFHAFFLRTFRYFDYFVKRVTNKSLTVNFFVSASQRSIICLAFLRQCTSNRNDNLKTWLMWWLNQVPVFVLASSMQKPAFLSQLCNVLLQKAKEILNARPQFVFRPSLLHWWFSRLSSESFSFLLSHDPLQYLTHGSAVCLPTYYIYFTFSFSWTSFVLMGRRLTWSMHQNSFHRHGWKS